VEGLGEGLELGARLVGPVPLQPQHPLELPGVLLGQPPRQLHHVQAGQSASTDTSQAHPQEIECSSCLSRTCG
jgi:hypothetical protein